MRSRAWSYEKATHYFRHVRYIRPHPNMAMDDQSEWAACRAPAPRWLPTSLVISISTSRAPPGNWRQPTPATACFAVSWPRSPAVCPAPASGLPPPADLQLCTVPMLWLPCRRLAPALISAPPTLLAGHHRRSTAQKEPAARSWARAGWCPTPPPRDRRQPPVSGRSTHPAEGKPPADHADRHPALSHAPTVMAQQAPESSEPVPERCSYVCQPPEASGFRACLAWC